MTGTSGTSSRKRTERPAASVWWKPEAPRIARVSATTDSDERRPGLAYIVPVSAARPAAERDSPSITGSGIERAPARSALSVP
ncbi:hypothetical protein GCM10010387_57130 [Streptomyces inusitatus]|uniref:Uncharacterized protein n=1 Tax=Streptomyces inusitatus TaxID=68221 RepID=A0A918QMG6_9ACTN|nr:hypothetical protein GCM10010387_57130 [Streptomyces inusitatus]